MKSVFYLFAVTMASATMITALLKPAKKKELLFLKMQLIPCFQLTVSILSVIILPEASENGWGLPAGDLLLNETEPLKHLFCR